jgi:hypothetical protein
MTSLGPTRRSLLRGLVACGAAALVPPIVALERKAASTFKPQLIRFSEISYWADTIELTPWKKQFLDDLKRP